MARLAAIARAEPTGPGVPTGAARNNSSPTSSAPTAWGPPDSSGLGRPRRHGVVAMEMHRPRPVSSLATVQSAPTRADRAASNRQAGHWVQAPDHRISSLSSLLGSSGDFLDFLFFLFSGVGREGE